MLPAPELAAAQADAALLLEPAAVTVLTRSEANDGAGGILETFTPQPPVAGRIAPISTANGTAGDRVDERSTHTVTLPAGATVAADDRVRLSGRDYEVTAVRTRTDELVRRVEVKSMP